MAMLRNLRTRLAFICVLLSVALAGRNFYEVLGVPRDASTAAIKSAYRKLSLKYHPGECVALPRCRLE